MDQLGINSEFLFLQLFNLLILCGWPLFSVITLFALRRQHIRGTLQAIWVLIVVAIPFIGPLAYWIVRPSGESE